MGRKIISRIGIATMGWLILAACVAEGAEEADATIARVGETAIERPEFEALLERLGEGSAADEQQRMRTHAMVLEQVVDEHALRAELLRLGIHIEPAAVEDAIERLRKESAKRGENFEAALAAKRLTLKALRHQIALEFGIQSYVKPRLTGAALARVFETNRRELDGTRLRVSHIILRPAHGGDDMAKLLDQAALIRSEVVEGRLSFDDAARQYSVGPSRHEGGDLGWINREGPLIDTFASQVYPLPKGGVTQPFPTPLDIHIATVTGIEPGRADFNAVRTRVEQQLAQQLVRELVVEGRTRNTVWFAPGVPHLDPATLGQPPLGRPVIVLPPEG